MPPPPFRIVGKSPEGFANLVAATMTSYAVPNEGTIEDSSEQALPQEFPVGRDGARPSGPDQSDAYRRAERAALRAEDTCQRDLREADFDEARSNFLSYMNRSGGAEAGIIAATQAVVTIWQLLEPIFEGGLRIIDQQRRAAAIREYLSTNGENLRTELAELGVFIDRKNRYERTAAARAFEQKYLAVRDGGITDDELGELRAAWELYDTLSRSSANQAFAEVDRALARMIRVSQGEYSGEDLAAAIRSLGASASAFNALLQNIQSLRPDGDKRDEWLEALRTLRLAPRPSTQPPDPPEEPAQ